MRGTGWGLDEKFVWEVWKSWWRGRGGEEERAEELELP